MVRSEVRVWQLLLPNRQSGEGGRPALTRSCPTGASSAALGQRPRIREGDPPSRAHVRQERPQPPSVSVRGSVFAPHSTTHTLSSAAARYAPPLSAAIAVA